MSLLAVFGSIRKFLVELISERKQTKYRISLENILKFTLVAYNIAKSVLNSIAYGPHVSISKIFKAKKRHSKSGQDLCNIFEQKSTNDSIIPGSFIFRISVHSLFITPEIYDMN